MKCTAARKEWFILSWVTWHFHGTGTYKYRIWIQISPATQLNATNSCVNSFLLCHLAASQSISSYFCIQVSGPFNLTSLPSCLEAGRRQFKSQWIMLQKTHSLHTLVLGIKAVLADADVDHEGQSLSWWTFLSSVEASLSAAPSIQTSGNWPLLVKPVAV